MGYPCSTGIGNKMNRWAWMSEKLSNEGQAAVVTFRVEFDFLRRLRFHNLLFMTMPDMVQI